MKKNEAEFVEALRRVGLSGAICESINNIRKAIFEGSEEEQQVYFVEPASGGRRWKLIYGEELKSVRDFIDPKFKEGRAKIANDNHKLNFIDEEGNIISDQWFHSVEDFSKGRAKVGRDNGRDFEYNLIDKNGNLLCELWFDRINSFVEGRAEVELKGKHNFIDEEGNLISYQWFDFVHNFYNGYSVVCHKNKGYNIIDKEGNIIGKQWFDHVWNFSHGYALVEKDGKRNFMDEEGNLISDKWFVGAFNDNINDIIDYKCVKLNNGKWNFINEKGKYLYRQSFDDIDYCQAGSIILVRRGEKWNFVGDGGKLLSNQWFDEVEHFFNDDSCTYDYYTRVKRDGKWNFINTEGKLLSDEWFDEAERFNGHDFARVILDGDDYLIYNDGHLIKPLEE